MLRILQLLDVDGVQADELAASRIDLHELERLRRAGCPSALAVEILR